VKIYDVSTSLGSRHPVVFGGSLGTLGAITTLCFINYPPTTNMEQITKCHCWQKDDGKLGEKCLQVIIDWSVDILVHGYGKDPFVSEYLVRSCWGFVDLNPIAGPGDWNSNSNTTNHYRDVTNRIIDTSRRITQDLVKYALPNVTSVLVFGATPFDHTIKKESE